MEAEFVFLARLKLSFSHIILLPHWPWVIQFEKYHTTSYHARTQIISRHFSFSSIIYMFIHLYFHLTYYIIRIYGLQPLYRFPGCLQLYMCLLHQLSIFLYCQAKKVWKVSGVPFFIKLHLALILIDKSFLLVRGSNKIKLLQILRYQS